ncbi:hypothetical protein [Nonomuraea ceibae]|nr:hypothetical protein [Nonomuraea ceibae]
MTFGKLVFLQAFGGPSSKQNMDKYRATPGIDISRLYEEIGDIL